MSAGQPPAPPAAIAARRCLCSARTLAAVKPTATSSRIVQSSVSRLPAIQSANAPCGTSSICKRARQKN
eukprot:5217510-Prymnesium_polylepis.1